MSSATLHSRRRKSLGLVTLAVVLACVLAPAAAFAQGAYTIVVNQVDGRGWPDIGLNITLLGPDGKAVPGLEASQFEIREEGQAQPVSGLALGPARNVPLSVVLAIDNSGSMAGEKLQSAKEAAIAFLQSLTPNDQATLVAFNTRVFEVVKATNDRAALEAGINSLQPGGNTAAFDALYFAATVVTAAPPEMRRAVILLTDGEDTASNYSARVASDVARQASALVYTIGLGPDAQDGVLTALAEGGGRYYKAPAPQDLRGIYEAIAIELSSQLLVSYQSTTRVTRLYQLVTIEVKWRGPDGVEVAQTVRYRPSRAALIQPTPIALQPTPTAVPPPPGLSKPPPAVAAVRVPPLGGMLNTVSAFGAMLVGVSILSLVTALAMQVSPSAASQRLASYTGDGAVVEHRVRMPNFASRALLPAMEGLGAQVLKLTPKGYTDHIKEMLILTGPPYKLQLGGFLGIQLALAAVFTVPLTWWALTTSPGNIVMLVLSIALGIVMGIYLPYFWLARKVQNRKKAILRALPGALDFLAINVEAGMGFDAALSEVVRRWRNPLTDEFAMMLIDFQIGKPRRDAWRDLVNRTQVTDLSAFVTAMLQNEQVGASIGHLLRVQAEHMRIRRRQRAEEAARVAPVKMLIPLVFFIFPGILVVLLGPAIPQVLDAFGNGGP
ncbi:MAG TPA: VWA domain-containing protein [Chloroflexia bacterium]|nr:VWA domain-containing protein [Chloroflexia bacterium]